VSAARRPVGSAVRLAVITAALAGALAPASADWVEREYSSGWYLAWQRRITGLSNLVPFALFDLLLVAGLIIVVWWVARMVRVARGKRLRATGRLAADTLAVGALVYLAFLGSWGCNYRRVPLREKLDFDVARATSEANLTLARRSVTELNALHGEASGGAWTLDALASDLGAAYLTTQRQLAMPMPALPGRPKATLLSLYFRWAAIDGMTDPFFLEVLLNGDVLPFERPFTVAHEWAHLAGYADESEASFVGWVTCLNGRPAVRYSAWLSLHPYLVRSLTRDARASVQRELDPGPRADLRAISERLSRSAPRIRRAAGVVYDRFLKANRVEEGVASYDEVVTLLLATNFHPQTDSGERGSGWVPRLRAK
jgi:hypothetical protein